MWTKEQIRELLASNDKAVIRAMLALYNRQTATEQASHSTRDHNGRGFNGLDASIMSRFTEFYNQRGFLSPKMIALTRKKVMKYSGQLAEIANEKQGNRTEQQEQATQPDPQQVPDRRASLYGDW